MLIIFFEVKWITFTNRRSRLFQSIIMIIQWNPINNPRFRYWMKNDGKYLIFLRYLRMEVPVWLKRKKYQVDLEISESLSLGTILSPPLDRPTRFFPEYFILSITSKICPVLTVIALPCISIYIYIYLYIDPAIFVAIKKTFACFSCDRS